MSDTWLLIGVVVTVVSFAVVLVAIIRDVRQPEEYLQLMRALQEAAHTAAQETLRAAQETLRRLEAEKLLREFENGHEANARRMEQNNVPLAWWPTRTAKAIANGGSQLLPLYDLLCNRFDNEEVYDLAFRLNIRRDDIAGEVHSILVQNLLEFVSRRDRVDDLIVLGRTIRPDLAWPGDKDKGRK